MGNLQKREIIETPEHFFNAQKSSLELRIDKIKLSEKEEEEIVKNRSIKTIKDKALGLFKVGEIINTFLNWNEEVDNDLKEAKKEHLFASYLDKADSNEEGIIKIKQFLTNPQGNTLFNKILRILDDTPPDIELSNHLSNVLKSITNSDFEKLFEQHKYALGQIELMTPQAMTILSDYSNWPSINISSYSANGPKITSDWFMEFANSYSRSKGITDPSLIERVNHSVNDIINKRFIEAHLIKQGSANAVLTRIGKIIIPYLT